MKLLGFLFALSLIVGLAACSEKGGSPTDPGDVYLRALVAVEFVDSATDNPIDNSSYCASIDTGVSGRQGPWSIGSDGRTPRVELAVPEAWADKFNQHTGTYWFDLCASEICAGGVGVSGTCYLGKNGTARFQWVEDNFGGGHWLATVSVAEKK
ncbi:MAG TPA: hypothetical protein VNA25_29365 [Phycisphaerae bacterium]|nr:hypothetical protein [Phycisphaerae bacterium]